MSDPTSEFLKRSLPYLGLVSVVGLGFTIWQSYTARSDLSERARSRAIEACAEASDADDCRDRVDRLHDDCFQWSLTDHDERPNYDHGRYQRCLEQPPGKFR